MGVSRIDTLTHFTGAVAAGTRSNGGTGFQYPVNGLVSLLATGTFGGGTLTLEVSNDGTNWVSVGSITAAGQITWQGCATYVSAKMTGGTGATGMSVTTSHVDY